MADEAAPAGHPLSKNRLMDARFVKGFVSGLLLAAFFVTLVLVLLVWLLPATHLVDEYRVTGLRGAVYRLRRFGSRDPICPVTDEEREAFLRLNSALQDDLNNYHQPDGQPACKEVRKLVNDSSMADALSLLTDASPMEASQPNPKWTARAEDYLVARYLTKVPSLYPRPEMVHIVEIWELCNQRG